MKKMLAMDVLGERKMLTCKIKNCKRDVEVIYYGFAVCKRHWIAHCEGRINIKQKLNIKENIKQKSEEKQIKIKRFI